MFDLQTAAELAAELAPPHEAAGAECTPGSGRPRLLDQLRQQIRRRHYSLRTELHAAPTTARGEAWPHLALEISPALPS